jgi:hypothetical protein
MIHVRDRGWPCDSGASFHTYRLRNFPSTANARPRRIPLRNSYLKMTDMATNTEEVRATSPEQDDDARYQTNNSVSKKPQPKQQLSKAMEHMRFAVTVDPTRLNAHTTHRTRTSLRNLHRANRKRRLRRPRLLRTRPRHSLPLPRSLQQPKAHRPLLLRLTLPGRRRQHFRIQRVGPRHRRLDLPSLFRRAILQATSRPRLRL